MSEGPVADNQRSLRILALGLGLVAAGVGFTLFAAVWPFMAAAAVPAWQPGRQQFFLLSTMLLAAIAGLLDFTGKVLCLDVPDRKSSTWAHVLVSVMFSWWAAAAAVMSFWIPPLLPANSPAATSARMLHIDGAPCVALLAEVISILAFLLSLSNLAVCLTRRDLRREVTLLLILYLVVVAIPLVTGVNLLFLSPDFPSNVQGFLLSVVIAVVAGVVVQIWYAVLLLALRREALRAALSRRLGSRDRVLAELLQQTVLVQSDAQLRRSNSSKTPKQMAGPADCYRPTMRSSRPDNAGETWNSLDRGT
jgi:hypothetical protein